MTDADRYRVVRVTKYKSGASPEIWVDFEGTLEEMIAKCPIRYRGYKRTDIWTSKSDQVAQDTVGVKRTYEFEIRRGRNWVKISDPRPDPGPENVKRIQRY